MTPQPPNQPSQQPNKLTLDPVTGFQYAAYKEWLEGYSQGIRDGIRIAYQRYVEQLGQVRMVPLMPLSPLPSPNDTEPLKSLTP